MLNSSKSYTDNMEGIDMMFSYFMLYVKDIEEHIKFYEEIMGLEKERYYEEEGGRDGGMIKVDFMVDR